MNRYRKFIFILLGVVALASCKRFPDIFDRKVLAEVGNQVLYLHEVTSIFTPGLPAEDSIKILQGYVDQWVKKQLKIAEAEKMFKSSQEDIDKMVADYRNSLLTYKVDQYYVDKMIDTVFSNEDISEYYNSHKADFVLDKTILKARVVRVNNEYRQIAKLKEMMLSSKAEDYQDFVDICIKNGFELTEVNNWSELPAVLQLLPTSKNESYEYVLKEGKLHEFKKDDYTYFLKTLSSRGSGEYVPEESVKEVIQRIIFNQRKQKIITSHEDSLFRVGVSQKEVVVNVNP